MWSRDTKRDLFDANWGGRIPKRNDPPFETDEEKVEREQLERDNPIQNGIPTFLDDYISHIITMANESRLDELPGILRVNGYLPKLFQFYHDNAGTMFPERASVLSFDKFKTNENSTRKSILLSVGRMLLQSPDQIKFAIIRLLQLLNAFAKRSPQLNTAIQNKLRETFPNIPGFYDALLKNDIVDTMQVLVVGFSDLESFQRILRIRLVSEHPPHPDESTQHPLLSDEKIQPLPVKSVKMKFPRWVKFVYNKLNKLLRNPEQTKEQYGNNTKKSTKKN